ncbi:universal stress protein [Nocardioides perillae]|uniref:Nucleotide-binding universal stress UspA family protein n=1 Tax=Nocardioides perillae TaxID=1119534 RepID=A0A7Y9RR15_9ACTN|nr:universal stress protein [Nocardioides perillae]NYG54981.1 nucleotide-binding universal stress UspA family protein [Nocardioides perillae]
MTVVVGYVPTPEGAAALEQAVDHVRSRDARLVVVNTSRGDRLVDERYALDDQVARVRERLDDAGVAYDVVHGVHGREAHDELLDAARDHRADLLVIGLRRRTPVGKLLLGSTAQRVLLEARCPVLAVKP